MSERCSREIWTTGLGGRACRHKGTLLENGKWWCKQHAPSTINKRNQEQKARWDASRAAQAQLWREKEERKRRAECFPNLIAALKWIAANCVAAPSAAQACALNVIAKAQGDVTDSDAAADAIERSMG